MLSYAGLLSVCRKPCPENNKAFLLNREGFVILQILFLSGFIQ